MAVRAFSGTNVLDTAPGALSTNTFGTFAAIVKRGATGSWHTFLALHSSGGGALNQFAYNSDDQVVMWSNGDNATGPAALAATAWGLVVVRKATGSATPRFSLYNFTADTWAHANGSMAIPNWSAPGASGTVRFRWETFDHFVGRVAVRAAWNTVKWAADSTGDAALEAAGLQTSLQKWVDAAPDGLWPFNQAATTTAVTDITGNGANQTTLTGTTVVTGDDPPGFSFALGGGSTDLIVAGATHAHTAGSPALVQNSDLIVASATQQQTSGNVALTQVHALSVDGSTQQQTSETVSLTGESSLAVADASQAQTADIPSLTQVHSLAVEGATQSLISDIVVLTAGGSLAVQDALHAQIASSVALTQQHTLTVADVLQAQMSGLVDLEQEHQLLVAGALHQQLADLVELVPIGEYEAPQEGMAIVRPMFTLAIVRVVTATAVVRSPTATASVRSPDETG